MLTRLQRLGMVALFLASLWGVVEWTGLRGHLTLAFVHDQFEAHAVQGALFFTLIFCLGNLVQIPGWIFLAAAVLSLGRLQGGLLTYIAANVSCAVTFLLIRLLGGDALRQFRGRFVQRAFAQLDARPVRSIAVLRVLLQTVPALNYALALSGVKFRSYLFGTLLGLPLPIALYCVFFDSLAHLLHLSPV